MIQEGNLSFLGAAAGFHRISGSAGRNDKFNFDVWNEKWNGPATKFEAFRRLWPQNKEHPTYKWLYLVELTWSEGPEIEAVLQFKGTLERHPKENRESDTRREALQLKNETVRTTAEYYKPVSIFRWIHVGDHPTERRFPGVMLAPNFAYEIFNLRGPGNIRIAGSATGGTTVGTGVPTSTEYTLQPRVIGGRFNCQQVGRCWQVTEENEGILEPPAFRPVIARR